MPIDLLIKVIYWNQILLKFFKILYGISYKVTFSMRKVNFWFFFLEKKKKFCC